MQHESTTTGDLQSSPLWGLSELSRNPFIDARALAGVTGRPRSQVYDTLKALFEAGLAGRVRHSTVLLPSVFRYYATPEGISETNAALNLSMSECLRAYPVSREWMRILIGRMDAVAGIHALAAALSPGTDELCTRVAFHRKGTLDAIITRHDGRAFGVVRQGRALRRRSLRDRLMRLWQYGYDAGVLLILTPSPWEASMVVRWGESRGYSGAYVAAESAAALTGWDERVWRRMSSVVGGVLTLDEVVAETQAYDGSLAGSPSRRLASLPEPKNMVQDAATFGMTRQDKTAFDIITAHPRIPRTHLFEWLGVSESGGSQILRSLQGRWGLVERCGRRGERRYALSLEGIRYITTRDRGQLPTTRGTWSTAPLSVPRRGRRHEGHLIDTWASRTAHTDGITWWLSRLATETRDDPDSEWRWWVPEAWTTRPFHWGEHTIAPDAVGELVASRNRISFFLEYERRARYRRGITRRLMRYHEYYISFDTGGDLPTLPFALFVVDEADVADRYVKTARKDRLLQLPILVSSMPELASIGILGRSWHPLWEPDSPTVRLADVAAYAWNRLSRRMERGP